VNVGILYCTDNTDICEKLDVDHGTWFYHAGLVTKDNGLVCALIFKLSFLERKIFGHDISILLI